MLIKFLNRLSARALTKLNWALTTLSGVLTAGLIIILES